MEAKKGNIKKGDTPSDKAQARLIVDAITNETGDEDLELDIMHRPEAIGNENVAYLIFGIPGTASYSFMDLNHLPGEMVVTVTVSKNGTVLSRSEFSGNAGNNPVNPGPR